MLGVHGKRQNQGIISQVLPLQRLQLSGLTSPPPPRTKSVEPSLLARCAGCCFHYSVTGAHVAPSTSKARGAFPSRPRTGCILLSGAHGLSRRRRDRPLHITRTRVPVLPLPLVLLGRVMAKLPFSFIGEFFLPIVGQFHATAYGLRDTDPQGAVDL